MAAKAAAPRNAPRQVGVGGRSLYTVLGRRGVEGKGEREKEKEREREREKEVVVEDWEVEAGREEGLEEGGKNEVEGKEEVEGGKEVADGKKEAGSEDECLANRLDPMAAGVGGGDVEVDELENGEQETRGEEAAGAGAGGVDAFGELVDVAPGRGDTVLEGEEVAAADLALPVSAGDEAEGEAVARQ